MSETCPMCLGTGVIEPSEHRYVSEHDKHRIRDMLQAGATYRQIAEAVGFSPAVIYKHARNMGVNSKFKKNIITSMEARDAMAQKDIPKS